MHGNVSSEVQALMNQARPSEPEIQAEQQMQTLDTGVLSFQSGHSLRDFAAERRLECSM